tara:strand:- start:47 stop:937 length:891 start_codon:yes stop_codon:yes gene_type:complete
MKHNKSIKKLAICIPTFNRAKLLDRLLKSIPKSTKIVVSICDDGSSDDTFDIVNRHKSRFLIKYSYQKNAGRASALRNAILNVNAQFMLIMGSDDYFTKNGIKTILNTLKKNKSIKFFVFPTAIQNKIGSTSEHLKGIPLTNYVKLRSDFKIKRDLKEVVDHKIMKTAMYNKPKKIRRIPTSYLWFKISKIVDCLPVKSRPVIIIEYSEDGMSKNLFSLKINNPKYIALTYKMAMMSKRYSSKIYRFRYAILYYRYSFHDKTIKLIKFRDLPLFIIGYVLGISDLLRLAMMKIKIY